MPAKRAAHHARGGGVQRLQYCITFQLCALSGTPGGHGSERRSPPHPQVHRGSLPCCKGCAHAGPIAHINMTRLSFWLVFLAYLAAVPVAANPVSVPGYYEITSGACPEVMTSAECKKYWQIADQDENGDHRWQYGFTEFGPPDNSAPYGCMRYGTNIWYNPTPGSPRSCGYADRNCLCRSPLPPPTPPFGPPPMPPATPPLHPSPTPPQKAGSADADSTPAVVNIAAGGRVVVEFGGSLHVGSVRQEE